MTILWPHSGHLTVSQLLINGKMPRKPPWSIAESCLFISSLELIMNLHPQSSQPYILLPCSIISISILLLVGEHFKCGNPLAKTFNLFILQVVQLTGEKS